MTVPLSIAYVLVLPLESLTVMLELLIAVTCLGVIRLRYIWPKPPIPPLLKPPDCDGWLVEPEVLFVDKFCLLDCWLFSYAAPKMKLAPTMTASTTTFVIESDGYGI